eukprot:gene34795-42915_t
MGGLTGGWLAAFDACSTKSGKKKNPKGGGPTPGEAQFKHDRPAVRERPVSAKLFRAVATADPEFKVHYRHTNYRRMPLTETQEVWLEEREISRVKKSHDLAHKLHAEMAAKGDKKKGDKGGDKKKEGDKKSSKKGTTLTLPPEGEKVKSKYSSADQFMTVNFPNFEKEDNPETIGPMRAMQLIECARVTGAFEEFGLSVKESVLRKALIIPQDRPEAICLENLRDNATEGLMVNPLAKEFWRKFSMKGGKKKGGGKKKKSKK